jgi:hypothetical protein
MSSKRNGKNAKNERQKLPPAPRLTLLTATINHLKEEGRRKKEEGRRKKEEGRRKGEFFI